MEVRVQIAPVFAPMLRSRRLAQAALFVTLAAGSGGAFSSTITQNLSWTINRSGATNKYRVVAYGDSIFAGYHGSLSSVAKRAAPYVDAEYAQKTWNASVELYRRTKSGAVASDIYNNKIVAERSYMQAADTRVVMFEMCGNDFLQARSSFAGQSGTCNYGVLDTALANCTTYQVKAMQYINANAAAGTKAKLISNLYYPGYNGDNHLSSCNDPATGRPINLQDKFLPYLAHSNWRACSAAAANGFACVDAFAEFMGADYDSNGDGLVDSVALRYQAGEPESAYVTRISQTLRATLRDAGTHYASAGTSYDYLQSDNTHPTYSGGTVSVGFFGGTGSGSGAPDYSDAQLGSGKNPVWNQLGHERMGQASSAFTPATP
jgi:lysophospholipase L1-like esterase